MKNLKYIFILALLIIYSQSFGQSLSAPSAPFIQGDILITHSSSTITPSAPTNVVRMFHGGNMAGINSTTGGTRFTWTPYTPGNNKSAWLSHSTWTETKLGKVFGITIQDSDNFYVANSSLYTGENLANHDKIWLLHPSNNTVSVAFDFLGTDQNKGIGNIKYFENGADKYIATTWWEDGSINILHKGSSGTWVSIFNFKPKFGNVTNNLSYLPYGIAIKAIAGGFRLYYGKFFPNSYTYLNNNEIWTADINLTSTTGSIISESTSPYIIFTNSSALDASFPVADISISADGNKMLFAQQTTPSTTQIAAHHASVYEYDISTSIPTLIGTPIPAGCPTNSNSAVGGVSYWNNVLFENNNLLCDTTVLFSADFIYRNLIPPATEYLNPPIGGNNYNNNTSVALTGYPINVYGFQGMPSNTSLATITDKFEKSLKVDADDLYNQHDKWLLGDIEAYNLPLNCGQKCDCGDWGGIGLGDNTSWWTNTSAPGNPPAPPIPSLSIDQGSSTGILFPHYNCKGNCNATFTYNLISPTTGLSTALSGTTSLDLGQSAIKNLPCGSYFISITPTCGQTKCPPIRIPLVIVCPPPCSDCGGNATVTSQGNPIYQNGTISGNFVINNATPVSEVRMMVEEFRLVSSTGNENCILCKNTPKTWGSIQSAVLSSIAPSFSNAVTIDNREAVFNNGGIITMPANLSFSLALPQTTGLDCCNLKAEICVKIIIRDVNCCEKEILKCFTVDLK